MSQGHLDLIAFAKQGEPPREDHSFTEMKQALRAQFWGRIIYRDAHCLTDLVLRCIDAAGYKVVKK